MKMLKFDAAYPMKAVKEVSPRLSRASLNRFTAARGRARLLNARLCSRFADLLQGEEVEHFMAGQRIRPAEFNPCGPFGYHAG